MATPPPQQNEQSASKEQAILKVKSEDVSPNATVSNLGRQRVVAPPSDQKEKKKRSRKEPSDQLTATLCNEAQKILKQADLLHLLLQDKLTSA